MSWKYKDGKYLAKSISIIGGDAPAMFPNKNIRRQTEVISFIWTMRGNVIYSNSELPKYGGCAGNDKFTEALVNNCYELKTCRANESICFGVSGVGPTSVLQIHEASTRGASVQACGSWVVASRCLMSWFLEEKLGTLWGLSQQQTVDQHRKFIGSLLCFNDFIKW